jgi:uncharacterized repeat protein (TIGR03803 family)
MKPAFPPFFAAISAAVITFAFTAGAAAQVTERTLFTFPTSGVDGAFFSSNLFYTATGEIFGTASSGGTQGCGTVFKLSAPSGGSRSFTKLYDFTCGSDGRGPSGNIVFDAAGNLYGTALGGGRNEGVVYKLAPGAGGTWTESTVYTFGTSSTDGMFPSGLMIDSAGNLYGTTPQGGTNGVAGDGTVYQLAPNSSGGWSETVLYNFSNLDTSHGALPNGGLILDSAGNLYGTTSGGGAIGWGTVFKLSPQSGGGWTESVLYSFPGGRFLQKPEGALLMDAGANLYGTTAGSDTTPAYGAAFQLTPNPDGTWTEKTLHRFGQTGDGQQPTQTLTQAASGDLFGTTVHGGSQDDGVVFRLHRNNSGQWSESVLYNFSTVSVRTFVGMTFAPGPVFYGIADSVATSNGGIIYAIAP